jgi:hypothetical protein
VKAAIGWEWPIIATSAAAVALGAGSYRFVAVPAATVAVVAASLAVVGVVRRARVAEAPAEDEAPEHPGGLREAFVGGELGRVDLVLACDLLERKLSQPNLRARAPAELDALVRVPPGEFRRYLTQRIAELEATS